MLKKANIYEENGRWYMHLEYEIEEKHERKIHIIPKLELPYAITHKPATTYGQIHFDGRASNTVIHIDESLILHSADIVDPMTGEVYKGIEGIFDLEQRAVDMTIEDIEKALGYKIKIVANKEEKK